MQGRSQAHPPGAGRRWRRAPGLGTGRAPLPASPGHPEQLMPSIPGRGRINPRDAGLAGLRRNPAILILLLAGTASAACVFWLRQTWKPLLRFRRAGVPAPRVQKPSLGTPTSPGPPQAFMTLCLLSPASDPLPSSPRRCRPLLWATDSIFSLPLAFLGQIRLIVTKCWLSLEKQLNSFDYI